MGLLSTCEELFGSANLYTVLGIEKDASAAAVKKAYHKLSLSVHPDRNQSGDREAATAKFQCVGGVYSVLSDPDKRELYDQTGEVDEEGDPLKDTNKDWEAYWRDLFPKVTLKDIQNFEKEYQGSEEERGDLKKAYLDAEGDMATILETVMCAKQDDEERFRGILKEMIDNKEVKKFKAFTNESKKSKQARKRAADSEAAEAEAAAAELGLGGNDENSLRSLILARQADRGARAESFLDGLAEKYSKKGKGKKK